MTSVRNTLRGRKKKGGGEGQSSFVQCSCLFFVSAEIIVLDDTHKVTGNDTGSLCVPHRIESGAGGHAVEMSGTESCLL